MAKNTKITICGKKTDYRTILNPKLPWTVVREAEVKLFEGEIDENDFEEQMLRQAYEAMKEDDDKFTERLLKTFVNEQEYWFRATFDKHDSILAIEEAEDRLMGIEQPLLHSWMKEWEDRKKGIFNMSETEFEALYEKIEEIRQSNIQHS